MTAITPLESGHRGAAVANLQDALLLFLEKSLIVTSVDEQRSLADALRGERRVSGYGDATLKTVSLFQESHRLQASGAVDAGTASTMNSFLRQLDAVRQEPDAVIYAVTGRVVGADRAGLGGLRVEIVDRNAGDDVRLATTVTGDEGRYQARFTVGDLRRRGKDRPDLQARAFAGAALLGASAVRYDASRRERLDVLLRPDAASALPSEIETLTSALSTYFKGDLRELQESDDREDITYLANKTGWDARAVALAALADQFSERTANAAGVRQIEPAFFYGLFRAGVPANENGLYQITGARAAATWRQAVQQGVLPARLEGAIPEAAAEFQRIAAVRALSAPALAGLSSFKELIAVSLGDDEARNRRFADLYAEHRHDPPKLWEAVRATFGDATEARLRLDGQLAYLTLNNAGLVRKLHGAFGAAGMPDAVSLASEGYFRSERWRELIGTDPIPPEIPGDTSAEQRARYAEALAAQVRLSFPTMVVAQMVRDGDTLVASDTRDRVHAFLTEHQGRFEIGTQSAQRYIARNRLQVAPEVSREIGRIQRVRQMTPTDTAMNALLRRGVDSALAASRYDRERFVATFRDDMGESDARGTHSRARQVHNVIWNLATSYLVSRSTPQIGAHSSAKFGKTVPTPVIQAQEAVAANQADNIYDWLINVWGGMSDDNAEDVISYATLEKLFGGMDYCACDHCRSWLSPAAYLVDLLHFLDRSDEGDEQNPLKRLLARRPDIEHLPLTCENTHQILPYIDIVNETLEYFVANHIKNAADGKQPLDGYTGHSTDASVTPEELLATPQSINDAVSETAYRILAGRHEPNEAAPLLPPVAPLPFHQPLETVRRFFTKFETPLAEVMELLRTGDAIERPAAADPDNPIEYGWRDILMEELQLSRAEHRRLTDGALSLSDVYGFKPGTSDTDIVASLSNAKTFARRLGVSYEELAEILKTRFVNPASILIPKLEKLGAPFVLLKAFKDGTMTAAQTAAFDELVAQVDPATYGGDVKAWVADDGNYPRIMSLITLTDPGDGSDPCNFDNIELRYANPVPGNILRPFDFRRLLRFIRLWKKLGWTIEQTDKAITALYPASQTPDSTDDAVNLQRLDAGFLALLPRLGVVRRLMKALKLKVNKDLLPLLACFAPIDTHGPSSLYARMFLQPSPTDADSPFLDDGFGNYLTAGEGLLAHAESLRAAFLLTGDELAQIAAALAFNDETPLALATVSDIFRRGWLARRLKVSVRELLLLIEKTGIDPFSPPDPPYPPIAVFTDLLMRARAASVKPEQVLYLLWNQDISGKSSPGAVEVLDFARTVRAAFAAIESEFTLVEDPNGQIARSRMALVYGTEATNFFFGLLDNTLLSEVAYDHDAPSLQQPILDAAPGRISYDDFRKRLSFAGVLSASQRDALKGVSGVSADFQAALDAIYAENQSVVAPFFSRYPELQGLHDSYVASAAPIEEKRSGLLAAFLPELKGRRKHQQALAAASAAASADIAMASAILDDKRILNPAAVPPDIPFDDLPPALDDLTAMENAGLSARLYAGAAVGDPEVEPDHASDFESSLAYPPTGDGSLPFNPASGIWTGYIEVPENGFYNFSVEPGAVGGAGADAATLTLEAQEDIFEKTDEVLTNTKPVELRAGTLYRFRLVVENVTTGMAVRWQTQGRGWEVIPPRYLYSDTLTGHLRATYVRFLKTASMAAASKLTSGEIAYLTAHEDYRINGRGWLDSLPVVGSADAATSTALLKAFNSLLEFATLKKALAPATERLLAVLENPAATLEAPGGAPGEEQQSLLLAVTRWDSASLDALLLRFGKHMNGAPEQADRTTLAELDTFVRVSRAFAPVKKIGVSGAALIAAATNEPQAAAVRAFKSALRARYEESDWLTVLRPIHDDMRSVQRDALVGYILHQLRMAPASAHIDTPEKLFEYLLMDVQMDPCMQTSRVRHALSSVQLFIERCFMNLEAGLEPNVFSADDRKRWDWMKRYRVWEANRKVFLWPENWVEPELRRDQSPFFKEALSDLLQGDITEDRAASALLTYLSKLETVAKLEPCGIRLVEGTSQTSKVAHVVGRTSGANPAYFYRRYDGLWSPWEEIKADIQDDPVVPVVWKDRLFLFSLKILNSPPAQSEIADPEPGPEDLQGEEKPLGQCTPSELTENARGAAALQRLAVQAVLCWSEYYDRKWHPTKTSDINAPTIVGTFNLNSSTPFDRSTLRLSVFEHLDALCVRIVEDDGGYLAFSEPSSFFVMHNTHSLPVPSEEPSSHLFTDPDPQPGPKRRDLSDMFVYYHTITWDEDSLTTFIDTRQDFVLDNAIPGRIVQPMHLLKEPWTAPFFYGDSRHVFYVTPTQSVVRVPSWAMLGVDVSFGSVASIQSVVLAPIGVHKAPSQQFAHTGLGSSSGMQKFISKSASIRKGIPMTRAVRIGTVTIGPAGRVDDLNRKR